MDVRQGDEIRPGSGEAWAAGFETEMLTGVADQRDNAFEPPQHVTVTKDVGKTRQRATSGATIC